MSKQYLSAVIEEDVVIGQHTSVWYFAHIAEGARIGVSCNIGERVYIGKGVIIGDNVRIGNGANIYEGTIIRNNVFIGNNTSFTNVRKPQAGRKGKLLDTIVEDGVSIGAGAVVVGGVKIGRGAIVADGAVVVGHIPEGAWANGNPARIKIKE